MELIFFTAVIAVLIVGGIALGLLVGRAIARRTRREEDGEDAWMTPVGPPPDPDAGEESGPAGDDAGDGGDGGNGGADDD